LKIQLAFTLAWWYRKQLKANDLRFNGAEDSLGQGLLLEAELSSDLNDLVKDAIEIADSYPEIIREIDHDLDIHGLKKKTMREADRRFFERLNPSFDSMADLPDPDTCPLDLEGGRPRMPAIIVYVLLLLRGWIGGPKSTEFRLILKESITLHRFFETLQFQVPGTSTVADNVNAVRESTLHLILRSQLGHAKATDLDTFEEVVIDSTSVSANSKYPTDSSLLAALAMRMTGLFDRLRKLKLGFPDWTKQVFAMRAREIAEEIELQAKRIGMMSGKQNVKTQRKVLYAKIYTRVGRLARVFGPILATASKAVAKVPLPPSKAQAVAKLIEQSQKDLSSIERISAYSRKRIFRDQNATASEKVISISDEDTAIIKKGGWEIESGYKPQLAFSGKGLATAHCLPRGNAADSGQLSTVLEANEQNTGVVPKDISLDDGYTNRKVREEYIAKHKGRVEVFSFAGAKGRAAIEQETYESDAYRKARNNRSAVESRIFTLKFNHGYEDVMRRGLEAVRHEQLTKVLSYNIRRIVWLRKEKARAKRNEALKKEAA
jgi:hypothetical protein